MGVVVKSLFNKIATALFVSITVLAYIPIASATNNHAWWHNWGWGSTTTAECTSNESDTQYWQWSGEQNLTLNGDARYQSNALELTHNLHQTSTAFWSSPFSLYTQHGSARSFSAAFSFTIDNPKGLSDHDGQGGDGLAFIINNSDQELGAGGAGLGYAGLQNSVAVEFDTYNNGWKDRHSGNHIGINLGGNTRSKHARRLQQRLNDDVKRYVWIDYKARQRKLEVRISTHDERPRHPAISKRIPINWWLNSSEAYIGFSAATSEAGNTHTIHDFEFVTAYAPIGECEPPEFISEPIIEAVAEIDYSYQAQASDATSGDTLTYSLINAPSGMTINSHTGLIEWLPTNDQVGEHPVEIQVTDSIGLSDQQSFVITVVENNQCNIEGNATVHYEQFDDLSAWQLNGTAAQLTPNDNDVLRLTKALSQSGSAFLKDPIALTDDNGFKAAFSAAFSFKMSHPIGISDQDGKGADGLVFVVQTMDSNVGGNGGGIGYEGIQNSLGIEFDTWNNGNIDNNNGNHIGINVDGSVSSLKIKPIHKRLNNGQTWYAWVDYDGINQSLEIRLSKYPNRPVDAILTKDNINLPVILQNENAYIGFTSGTGAAGGKHDIKSFTFTNTLAPIGDCGELAIISTPPTEIITGQTLSYQLEVSGAETGAQLTYSITNGPSNATIDNNGLLIWQATSLGNVDFTVQVEDDNSNTAAEQSFTINVLPLPNQAPVANDINATTNEDSATAIILDAIDANGDNLTYSIVQQPTNGVLSGVAPNLVYTPNPNTNGTDSFTYQVNDGQVSSNVATVNITIIPQNDAPIANNQNITTNEDTTATGQLTASDIDSANLTYQLQQQAANGQVTLQSNGQFSYTPNANYNGNDSFNFIANDGEDNSNTATVSITINAINDAPVANNQSVSTDEDTAVSITLTANDTDGDSLTYTITQQPQNGTLTGTAPNLTYTPNENFNGSDSFNFIVNDGTENSNQATISLTVNSINDTLVADNQSVNLQEDTSIAITLTGSDTEGDSLTYSINTQPLNGSLSGIAPNLTYIPNTDFNGNDSFSFIVNDGTDNSNIATVDITVVSVNDEPTINITSPTGILIFTDADTINFAANANDIEDGDISNQIEWTASPGTTLGTGAQINTILAAGNYVVAAQITDSEGASVSDTITIQVVISNTAPVAQDLTAQVEAGQSVTIDLVAVDIDADPLTYAITTQPQNGSANLQNNQIVYTANAAFTGQDRIEYVANDGSVNSNIAEIIITVIEANEAPQITSQPNLQATEGQLYEYQVVANDSNAGDTLMYSLNNAPAGAVIDPQTGLIQWTPTAEQAGYNTDNNPYCLSSSESDADQRFADIVFVVDRSGSMGGETEFIQTLAPLLDGNLIQNNIGAGNEINQYGLVAFGGAPVNFEMDDQGTLFATSAQFYNATQTFRPNGGGTEDGYAAMELGLQYPVRDSAAKNLILVTDEGRDGGFTTSTLEDVRTAINDNGFILNTIVNANFQCEDGRAALGKGQNNIGYVADGLGGFTTCENVQVTFDIEGVEQTYIELALTLGGAAWDLNVLRAGGTDAQSFVRALLDIKVEEIQNQIITESQADIVIESLNYNNGQINLTIKNRGLVDITTPFSIDLLDDNNVITTLTINSLAISESQTLTHTHDLTGSLSASINTTAINECSLENNQLTPTQFKVSVSDDSGLSQTQIFVLTVANINQAPQITSTAPTVAPINSVYRYQVEVNDPDKAEGLNYTLIQAPAGMRIDSVSGLITFKPTTDQIGQYTIEVNVADINGLSDTQTYTLIVDNSYTALRFTSEPDIRAQFSTEYRYQPTVQQDATAILTYTLLLTPDSNMSVNNQTGEIIWPVPADAVGEQYPVVFQVEDQFGNYDIQAYELFGDGEPEPPILIANGNPNLEVDDEYLSFILYYDRNYILNRHEYSLLGNNHGAVLTTETVPCSSTGTSIEGATGHCYRDNSQQTRGRFIWTPDVTIPSLGGLGAENNFCLAPGVDMADFEVTQTQSLSHYRGFPMAGPLYDNNLDGALNNNDRRFIFGYNALTSGSTKPVVAIDALTGKTVWQSVDRVKVSNPGALIDLDGDANAELIFTDSSNNLMLFNSDGTLRWRSTVSAADGTVQTQPIPVDINNDGIYEIAFGPSLFDANGNLLWQFPRTAEIGRNAARMTALPIDFDLDGTPEFAYFNQVRDAQGNILWTLPTKSLPTSNIDRLVYLAYANFDNDPEPELVINEGFFTTASGGRFQRWLMLVDNDGSIIWETETNIRNIGRITIADVDQDNDLEIYLPGSGALFDHNGNTIWQNDETYYNGAIADINADGRYEILERSIQGIGILDASTGLTRAILPQRITSTWTPSLFFADIDNDQQGEIVLTGGSNPFLVYDGKNNNWADAPTIYSHYQQNLGSVNESLRITPSTENQFALLNKVSGNSSTTPVDLTDLGQADVVVHGLHIDYRASFTTDDEWQVRVKVGNQGFATAENILIEFYSDNPGVAANKFGELTLASLQQGTNQDLTLSLDNDAAIGEEIYVVLSTQTQECYTNNNAASAKVFNFQVTDPGGLSDRAKVAYGARQQSANIVTSIPATTATVGQLYEYQVVAEGIDRNKIYYMESRIPGASFDNQSGLLTWVPTPDQANRTYSISIIVHDEVLRSGASVFQNFTVSVAPEANTAPQITSTEVTAGRVGQLYNYQVIANDPNGDNIQYFLQSAPAGMSINGLSGLVSWTPTTVGDYNITVRARDERNAVNDQTFILTIAANQPPVISSTPAATATTGEEYTYNVIASDPEGDALTYNLTQAPTGMIINASGEISWIPTVADLGANAVEISVTDGGAITTQSYSITVDVAATELPMLVNVPLMDAFAGSNYEYNLYAAANGITVANVILIDGPPGMTIDFNPDTGAYDINWTPPEGDCQHDVTVELIAQNGLTQQQTFTITVHNAPTRLNRFQCSLDSANCPAN